MDFPRTQLASDLVDLATGVLVSTSSWKYEGWLDQLCSRYRYLTNRKLSKAKFAENCLEQYADVFKTACFNGTLYQFPTEKMIAKFFSRAMPSGPFTRQSADY